MRNNSSRLGVGKPLLNLLPHVEVVLDVLKRRILREAFKNALDLLFC